MVSKDRKIRKLAYPYRVWAFVLFFLGGVALIMGVTEHWFFLLPGTIFILVGYYLTFHFKE